MRRRIFQDPFEGQTNLFDPAPPAGPDAGEAASAPSEPGEAWPMATDEAVTEAASITLEPREDEAWAGEDESWAGEEIAAELHAGDDEAVAAVPPDTGELYDIPDDDATLTPAAAGGEDHRGERWSDLDGLPPLVTTPPPRRRPPRGTAPDGDGEPPRRRPHRPRRPAILRLVMAAALMMVAFAGMAAIVYRFASHDPDYDAIMAILNGETKAAAEERKRQAANPVPDFRWPCAGEISSLYGERIHPKNGRRSMHSGIDIAAPYYEMVFAAADGVVTWAARSGGKGNLVVIKHNDIYESQYFHLQKIKVKKGERVTKGDLIAWVGSTGYSTGPHLHLEIHKRGEPQDPALFLPPPAAERLVRLKRDGVDYPMGGN